MMNKNVLYLSYDGMTDPLGQSQVLPYLKGLSEAGYIFTLISFEKKERLNGSRDIVTKFCSNNNIDWHPLIYTKNPPVLATLRNISRMRRVAIQLHHKKNFSIVHCRSYIPAIVGEYLKRAYQLKFIFDMRGFWVDERIYGKIWNIKNPIYRIIYKYFKRKEIVFFEQCDYCISLTQAGKKEILKWTLKRERPIEIEVIPCCVDTTFFLPKITSEEKVEWKRRLHITDETYTICYLGNLSTVYLFDEVLRLILKLKTVNNNLLFHIFTHEDKGIVKRYLEKYNLKEAKWIFINALQRQEVPLALSFCDYSIYFIKSSPSSIGISPTRLAELLCCNVKVISNANVGDTQEIIENNNFGFVINDFSEQSINDFVSRFPFEKKYHNDTLIEYVVKKFDISVGVNRYLKVYNNLSFQ